MSILDSIASMVGGRSNPDARLLPALLEQLRNYPGGIAGLIAGFQEGGLGDIVNSWIGLGQNQPVTAEQLRTVIDPSMIENLARTSGEDGNAILRKLTSLLPLVIDKLTPDGSLRDEVLDSGELAAMLSKMTGRFQ